MTGGLSCATPASLTVRDSITAWMQHQVKFLAADGCAPVLRRIVAAADHVREDAFHGLIICLGHGGYNYRKAAKNEM